MPATLPDFGTETQDLPDFGKSDLPDFGSTPTPSGSVTYDRSVLNQHKATQGGPPIDLSGVAPGQAARDLGELAGEIQRSPSPIPNVKALEVKKDDNPFVAAGKEAANIAIGIPQFFTSTVGYE